MEYKQENFIEFIKKTKLPFVFTWPFNIGFLIIIGGMMLQTENTTIGSTVIGISFISMGFIGMKGFIYGMNYKMYSAGGQSIRDLGDSKKIILNEVGVYIKGFDVLSQKKMMPPNIIKTIYDFNNSDMVLTEKSIILMGKGFGFGFVGYAHPVELIIEQGMTNLPKAKITQWVEKGARIEIQIDDPSYTKIIKIEIKNEIEVIKQWLTKAKFHGRSKLIKS